MPSCLIACCENNIERVESIKKNFQDFEWYENYRDMLKNEAVETVVVATPPTSHFQIVKDCLESGKNVIAEKPLTLNVGECQELFELALNKNLQLFDHFSMSLLQI